VTPRSARAPLWALLAGNFVIGTGVMVVPGTLNEISGSLAVSAATAGQLVTAAAIVMCLGAPLLAAVVAGWDRRVLLTLSLLWYAAGHVVSALMPSFVGLLVVRMLTVIAPAVFTPQAAACVGLLVPPERSGQAVTFVFLGWSMASVLGLPIGALIGGHFGWQSAFMAVAVGAVIGAAWVWMTLPSGIRPAAMSREGWRHVFGSPVLMGTVAVTALLGAAQFVLFSYFAPVLRRSLQMDATALSLVWGWFGACGLLGNVLASRFIDRIGAARTVFVAACGIALSLLAWPLGQNLALLLLVIAPWGLGCFSANSAQQARLVALAPALAPASVALNSSGIYVGQALGAAAGGWLLANDQAEWLSRVGFVLALVAIGLSVGVERLRRARS